MLLGFDYHRGRAAPASRGIIAAGIMPVAIEFMDRPAIHVCEDFAEAGYPLDVEALLIVEVEGSEDEIDTLLEKIGEIATRYSTRSIARRSQSAEESAAHLEGPQGGLRRHRPHLRLLLHGRGDPARQAARGARRRSARSAAAIASTWPTSSMPATAICTRLILYNANDPVRARAGRAVRRGDPQAVRRARRLPDRRARRRHREARADARAVHRRRPGSADAGEDRVRSRLAAQSRPRCFRWKDVERQ